MKASKFSDAQKAFIIRQGDDGTPVEEICRKAGISQATYYAWKKKYAGMMPGWRVFVIWECQAKDTRKLERLASKLRGQ